MSHANEKERFEAWVTAMDDVLEQFKELLPSKVVAKLDASPESLNDLEAWILQSYPDSQAVKAEKNTTLIDGAARYLGEVLRSNLGGIWDIRWGKPTDVNNGIPLIVGYRDSRLLSHHIASSPRAPLVGRATTF